MLSHKALLLPHVTFIGPSDLLLAVGGTKFVYSSGIYSDNDLTVGGRLASRRNDAAGL